MPDFIVFDNWPVTMRQRELKNKVDAITAASIKPELDEKTQVKLRVMSIIDVLLRELESW
jgi:hypothetical protein